MREVAVKAPSRDRLYSSGSLYSVSCALTVAHVRPANDLLYVSSATSLASATKSAAVARLRSRTMAAAVASSALVVMSIDANGAYLAALLDDYKNSDGLYDRHPNGVLTLAGGGTQKQEAPAVQCSSLRIRSIFMRLPARTVQASSASIPVWARL